jgi:hypothetical protein
MRKRKRVGEMNFGWMASRPAHPKAAISKQCEIEDLQAPLTTRFNENVASQVVLSSLSFVLRII